MKRSLLILASLPRILSLQSFEDLSKKDQNIIKQTVKCARTSKLGRLVEKFPCLKQEESTQPLPPLCIERGIRYDAYPKKEMSALLEAGVPIDQRNKTDQSTALCVVGPGFAYWTPDKTIANHNPQEPCKTVAIIRGLLEQRADQTHMMNGLTPLEHALTMLDESKNELKGRWGLQAVDLYVKDQGFAKLVHRPLSQRNCHRWPTYLSAILQTTIKDPDRADKDPDRADLVFRCLQAGALARPKDLDYAHTEPVKYLLKRNLDDQPLDILLLDPQQKVHAIHAIIESILRGHKLPKDVNNITLDYAGYGIS